MALPRKKTRPRTKQPDPDKVDSKGHLQFLRTRFDCAVAGKIRPGERHHLACGGKMHAHHVRTVGAGGGDNEAVPLCAVHHSQIHTLGWRTFGAAYGVNLPKMAADLWWEDDYHRIAWERKKELAGNG